MSISRTSIDRAGKSENPDRHKLDKPTLSLQRQSRAHKHDETEKNERRKGYPNKSLPFKIYTLEILLDSWSKNVALQVADNATSESDCTLTIGTYVPKNAALGLARTTTQGAHERAKLSRQLSRILPSSLEESKGTQLRSRP